MKQSYEIQKSSFTYNFNKVQVTETNVINLVHDDETDKVNFEVCKVCYIGEKYFHTISYGTYTSMNDANAYFDHIVKLSELDSSLNDN